MVPPSQSSLQDKATNSGRYKEGQGREYRIEVSLSAKPTDQRNVAAIKIGRMTFTYLYVNLKF